MRAPQPQALSDGLGFDRLSPNGRGGGFTFCRLPQPFALSLSKGRVAAPHPFALSLSKGRVTPFRSP